MESSDSEDSLGKVRIRFGVGEKCDDDLDLHQNTAYSSSESDVSFESDSDEEMRNERQKRRKRAERKLELDEIADVSEKEELMKMSKEYLVHAVRALQRNLFHVNQFLETERKEKMDWIKRWRDLYKEWMERWRENVRKRERED